MPAKLHKNHQIMYFLSTSSSFFIIFLKLWSHFTNIICIFAVSSGEKSRTDDALLIDTHLTEGVWKTQFGIVRS